METRLWVQLMRESVEFKIDSCDNITLKLYFSIQTTFCILKWCESICFISKAKLQWIILMNCMTNNKKPTTPNATRQQNDPTLQFSPFWNWVTATCKHRARTARRFSISLVWSRSCRASCSVSGETGGSVFVEPSPVLTPLPPAGEGVTLSGDVCCN